MDVRTILWLVGLVLCVLGVAEIPSLVMALALNEPWLPFALSIALGLSVGGLLVLPARGTELTLNHRSAFLAVTLSWVVACLFGGFAFFHHPELRLSAIDAFFESASGFTTTGSTVLSGLDQLPRSLLLWRSLTQWLGGMGMVLLGVAVFPILGLGGMQLFKAEAPGPMKDKLTPRIAETAKILWILYLGVTVAEAILLRLGGMSLFDSVCHSMSTISTGGFSPHDRSLGYYNSGFIHVVTTGFMLLGGMSFAILHRALTQGIAWKAYPELRAYVGIFALAALVMSVDLRFGMPERYGTAALALEHSVFQAASIMTTTGFMTSDFDRWPPLSHAIIFCLFFIGGMAGSTGGGPKVIRVLLVVKVAFSQFFRLIHPRGFEAIKLGDRTVEPEIVLGVLGFIGMYVLLLFAGTALICLFGSDIFTGFSAAAVTLGNIVPGFAGVGPSHTYEGGAPAAKLFMASLMIVGRLEIYTALVILAPGFWKR
jgi:trk system potassium uptake protein TrkH